MIILGLTGGIGMGKSTSAKMLRAMGIPVFDADRWIHRALGKNGSAVAAVAYAFPLSHDKKGSRIDRRSLGAHIFGNEKRRVRLEAILHPLVRAAELRFIARHGRSKNHRIIVLDIPLLFETGANKLCDAAICVTAPPAVQRARVLRRPHMTEEKFAAIKAAQMDDKKRRRLSDYILDTGSGHDAAKRDLQAILRAVKKAHVRNRP